MIETFLARLYTDAAFLRDFLKEPSKVARAAGLGQKESEMVAAMNPDDLRLAADSYARKRAEHSAKR